MSLFRNFRNEMSEKDEKHKYKKRNKFIYFMHKNIIMIIKTQ